MEQKSNIMWISVMVSLVMIVMQWLLQLIYINVIKGQAECSRIFFCYW